MRIVSKIIKWIWTLAIIAIRLEDVVYLCTSMYFFIFVGVDLDFKARLFGSLRFVLCCSSVRAKVTWILYLFRHSIVHTCSYLIWIYNFLQIIIVRKFELLLGHIIKLLFSLVFRNLSVSFKIGHLYLNLIWICRFALLIILYGT